MNQSPFARHKGLLLGQSLFVASLMTCTLVRAGDQTRPKGMQPYNPAIAPASDEGERAIRSFRVAAGLKVELFAAEPLPANPVAFCSDEQGRFYVAETFRLCAGVSDTRGHMNWLDDDLACRTAADRVAMYKKYLGKRFEEYKVEHERVRQLVDRDQDFNVTTREGRRLAVPDTGSVLHYNPDGTELEVFATGLRNPQELAFDQFGNLFTCDNNSDSGDRARWVYLVEGGDSGWRIGYQFIEEPISRGPWTRITSLLAHAAMMVRQEAQFELVRRNARAAGRDCRLEQEPAGPDTRHLSDQVRGVMPAMP